MARADLLTKLVKFGVSGDKARFRKVAETIIAEERAKQHTVLAEKRGFEMNFILRIIMTFSSVSFFLVVYLVQNKIDLLPSLATKLGYSWIICLLYTAVPFVLGGIAVGICKLLAKSEIKKAISLETSNNDFLANYLAFFFVALSINNVTTFWIVLGITLLFTFFSRVSYFNPVFLIFGFNFFYVHTGENVKVLLISRKKLRSPESFEATGVRRINDYTFMEV